MSTTTIDSSFDDRSLEAKISPQEGLEIHQQRKLAYQSKYRPDLKLEGSKDKL